MGVLYWLMWFNLLAACFNMYVHNWTFAVLSFGVFLMCLKDEAVKELKR